MNEIDKLKDQISLLYKMMEKNKNRPDSSSSIEIN
jgi:hypothetical protein